MRIEIKQEMNNRCGVISKEKKNQQNIEGRKTVSQLKQKTKHKGGALSNHKAFKLRLK